MLSSNDSYEKLSIIEDGSHGLLKLSTIARHGGNRKTKIVNNFIGVLEAADSTTVLQLCQELNKRLPAVTNDEVVVGMYKSGIIMAGYLALARGTRFTWSTPDEYGDTSQVIKYAEDHHVAATHHFYGLKPGDKVVLVEDEVTSGKGLVGLVELLRSKDIEVITICSMLETVNFGGRELIKNSTGIELISLAKLELGN